jgi:SAM-dependent methyltransferase
MIFCNIKNSLLKKITRHIYNRYDVVPTDNENNREKWLESELNKLPKGIKILDAGAGELDKKKYCHGMEYISQDFAKYDGEGDGAGLQMGTWDQTKIDIISDITCIPVSDESFDAIICIEVLEHLPDPLSAIKELMRILKKGGTLIITAPFSSLTHFAPYHFCTGFNRYWYLEHFNNLGAESVDVINNGNYHALITQELGRLPYTIDHYASSKFNFIEDWAHRILMSKLSKLAKKDRLSQDLACFGYNVVVVK